MPEKHVQAQPARSRYFKSEKVLADGTIVEPFKRVFEARSSAERDQPGENRSTIADGTTDEWCQTSQRESADLLQYRKREIPNRH